MDDPERADSDFLNTSSCLLPPSYFAVSAPQNPAQDALWTRSALQAELERVRGELSDLREGYRGRGGSPHPEAAALLNEALAQQASELARSRSEWERERLELAKEASDWKAQAQAAHRQAKDIEAAGAKRLAGIHENFDRRVRETEAQAREAAFAFEKERSEWHRRANEEEEATARHLAEAKGALEMALSDRSELERELKVAATALEGSRREVERLRPFESWSSDRAEMLERCEQLEERLSAADETSQLKQQRLEALQAILSLQEAELVRHGAGEELESLKGLVSRWREKVFALMVQAEASAQVVAEDRRKVAAGRVEAARELERTRGLLAQAELRLQAGQAELLEERARVQNLSSQLRAAEGGMAAAYSERDLLRSSLSTLRTGIEEAARGVSAQEREFAARALAPLAALQRRVEGLTQRLPVVKAQMKRLRSREALEQAKAEFVSREADLLRELSVVRADRDRLAQQMERDAEERSSNETSLRGQYEAEIVNLERSIESLRLELDVKSENLERADQERGDLSEVCERLRADHERLEAALTAAERAAEEAAGAATTRLFGEHVQQMAELRAALEETRREHAKAVLSLRQSERDLERCRAERADEVAAAREAGQRRLQDLEAELARAAAEANLLRATVRQEGLLRARSESRAVTFAEEALPEAASQGDQGQGSPHKAPSEFQPHLVNLIQEVRSLVRSVETSDLFGTDEEEEEEA